MSAPGVVVIPAPPPPVPTLDADPGGATMVQPIRDAGAATENVSDWAEAGGMPPGWSGDASQAALHAMTRMARDAGGAVAVLTRVATGLATYFDTITTLKDLRDGLVEEHSSLAERQRDLAADGASYTEDDEHELRARAGDLSRDIDAYVGRIRAWEEIRIRAEDAVIALLQSSDTAREARTCAASEATAIRTILAGLAHEGTLPPNAAQMTSEQLRRWLLTHPEAAAALMRRTPTLAGGPAAELAALLLPTVTTPGGGAAVAEDRREAARALFEGLSTEDAALLAMLFPDAVRNLPGVPFENRADANTIAIVDALAKQKDALGALQARDEENEHDWDLFGRNNDDLDGAIEDARQRIALYQSILDNDRKIIYFDPSGDGAMAELSGQIDSHTRNLTVLVPGTGTDLSNFDDVTKRASSFVNARPDGDLAVVSWLGGDMPDSVAKDAPFADYSQAAAPRLADFSHDVRQELDHSGAATSRAALSGHPPETTYLGHSYGGAVVGLAEAAGLDADRVLHVESAGVGHDIFSPADLPASQAGVHRYSMTAPGDPIGTIAQGQQGLGEFALGPNAGHGADPDTFGDTVRLHTGSYQNGEIIRGLPAHGGVFTPQSDAWKQMLQVQIGGEAETYREPLYTSTYGGYGMSSTKQTGWGPGGTVDIP